MSDAACSASGHGRFPSVRAELQQAPVLLLISRGVAAGEQSRRGSAAQGPEGTIAAWHSDNTAGPPSGELPGEAADKLETESK